MVFLLWESRNAIDHRANLTTVLCASVGVAALSSPEIVQRRWLLLSSRAHAAGLSERIFRAVRNGACRAELLWPLGMFGFWGKQRTACAMTFLARQGEKAADSLLVVVASLWGQCFDLTKDRRRKFARSLRNLHRPRLDARTSPLLQNAEDWASGIPRCVPGSLNRSDFSYVPCRTLSRFEVWGFWYNQVWIAPAFHNNNAVRVLTLVATAGIIAGGGLFVPAALLKLMHITAFATWFGSTIWTTFVGGIMMFKNLPRQTFGKLQSKLFPSKRHQEIQ